GLEAAAIRATKAHGRALLDPGPAVRILAVRDVGDRLAVGRELDVGNLFAGRQPLLGRAQVDHAFGDLVEDVVERAEQLVLGGRVVELLGAQSHVLRHPAGERELVEALVGVGVGYAVGPGTEHGVDDLDPDHVGLDAV